MNASPPLWGCRSTSARHIIRGNVAPTKTPTVLRQYLRKNADLSAFTQIDLNEIAVRLDNRPRRVLGWRSPVEHTHRTTIA